MKHLRIILLFLSFSLLYSQGGYRKAQWDSAKAEAKSKARQAITEMIHGYYVQYRSVISLRENRSLMRTDLRACSFPLIKFGRFIGYKEMGLLRLKATVSKVNFIEALNAYQKQNTGRGLTRQEYQDFRFMFPDIITVYAFGACSKRRYNPGRRYINTIEAYKVEACVRLVNYLRGPTVSAVSRLNNFFLTQNTIEAILPKTLLRGAVFCVSEPNKYNPSEISLTIMCTGADWIFSVSSALKSQGRQLSQEEYLRLKTRFARYPEHYITFRLPDEVLMDPNDFSRSDYSRFPSSGGLLNPPLGFNEAGEVDVLWK